MLLDDVGVNFNTDKASTFRHDGGVERGHDYLRHYEAAISAGGRSPRTVLDLGVGNPEDAFASALMWERYFPEARIVAVDIQDRTVPPNSRIEFRQLDLGDARSLAQLAGLRADVIIDDASHLWKHQAMSLAYLLPSVPSGGLFILEDLVTSGAGLADQYAEPGYPNPAEVVGELASRLAAEGALPEAVAIANGSIPGAAPATFRSFVVETVLPLIDSLQIIAGSAIFRVK